MKKSQTSTALPTRGVARLALSFSAATMLSAAPLHADTAVTAAPEAPPPPPTPVTAPAAELVKIDPELEGRKAYLVRYGIQFSHESADFAQTKIASFAYLNALNRWWVYQFEVGAWADKGNGGEKNLKGAFFFTASIGVEAVLDSVFARILVGPTLISHTDDRLSTNFQIHHEFSLGLRGKNGLAVGGFLKHFSNGGIKLPNESRDLFGFLVQFSI